MNIIYILKETFQKRTSAISAVLNLCETGNSVTLIAESISDYWITELQDKGVECYSIPLMLFGKNPICKLINYLVFAHKALSIINEKYTDDTIVWVYEAFTISALGKRLKKYKYVLQIQELYEDYPRRLKDISRVIHSAQLVFMPQYDRCCIYQSIFHLENRPIVLPNKPYFIPSPEQLSQLEHKYSEQLRLFKEKKVILYQGHIHPERDLTNFIKAVDLLPDDYVFVLLGKDHGILKKYKAISNKVVHIDFVPAPDYLVFTANCFFGVVTYDPKHLNTTYCAPNKIYEYGAFGKPMLGNDIPGLKQINEYNAGLLVEDNVDSIKEGLLNMIESYQKHSQGAVDLFNSVDTKDIIVKSIYCG